jgi:flagellar hook-associated protein 2
MSSIDTKSLVSQLMAVERRPQDLLRTRVSALQKTQNAWQSIADKLTTLKTAADELAPMRAAASFTTASSSDDASIAVAATGAGRSTTASISVVSLATARTDVSTDVFSGASASLGSRTLSLTVNGETTAYTSADGTIGGLVSAINDADKGVSAKLLQTSPGQFQLSLTAAKTGTANTFSATSTGWSGFTNARPAADASILVDGVSVTRSSNSIDDVIEGLQLNLKKTTAAPIEVSFARDDQAINDKVKALVDAANGAMSTIASATRTSTQESARGPLASDPSARRLSDSIRSVIAAPITLPDGSSMTARSLGVSLNRDGTLKFDPAELKKSLSERPQDVLDALGRSASSTAPGVSVSSATPSAQPGTRSISVTQAATQASLVSVPSPPPPPGSLVNMTIMTPAGTYSVSFNAGDTYSQTASNMTAAMRSLGLRMSASPTSSGGVEDGISMSEDRYGSAHTFSVGGGSALGLDGPATAGLDAQGTINGTAFTAAGRAVASNGLALSIGSTASQITAGGGAATGTVGFSDGLAGALSRIGGNGAANGPAASAKAAVGDRIRDLEGRISRYDTILASREQAFVRKFANMDSLLSRLNTMDGSFA